MTFSDGQTVTAVANTGYTFNQFDSVTSPITEDTDITAKFDVTTFSVALSTSQTSGVDDGAFYESTNLTTPVSAIDDVPYGSTVEALSEAPGGITLKDGEGLIKVTYPNPSDTIRYFIAKGNVIETGSSYWFTAFDTITSPVTSSGTTVKANFKKVHTITFNPDDSGAVYNSATKSTEAKVTSIIVDDGCVVADASSSAPAGMGQLTFDKVVKGVSPVYAIANDTDASVFDKFTNISTPVTSSYAIDVSFKTRTVKVTFSVDPTSAGKVYDNWQSPQNEVTEAQVPYKSKVYQRASTNAGMGKIVFTREDGDVNF